MAYLSREARREQIVNAVVDIVSREGLDAATVRRIAQELDCSPGQIHHHFSSAEALRAEAVREVWAALKPKLDHALERLPPRERLRTVVAGCVDVLGGEAALLATAKRLWREARATRKEPEVRAAVVEGITKMREEITASLRQGIATGVFPSGIDVEAVAMRLIVASQGFDLLEEIDATGILGRDKLAFTEDVLAREGL